MNESNDQLMKEGPAHRGRRKAAVWKSGLMLSGLGAVVLGAGYLAGVNAPTVAQAAAQAAAPQSSSQSNLALSANSAAQRGQAAPDVSDDDASEEEESRIIGFDDQGNAVILREDGSLQFGSGLASGEGQSGQQFGGRRRGQLGGFSQQAPSFAGPVTRSRGS